MNAKRITYKAAKFIVVVVNDDTSQSSVQIRLRTGLPRRQTLQLHICTYKRQRTIPLRNTYLNFLLKSTVNRLRLESRQLSIR